MDFPWRIGILAFAEPLANMMHHEGANLQPRHQPQLLILDATIIEVRVLDDVAKEGTQHRDGPRNLHPQQEQRNRRQRAVDDIVAGEKHLQINVAIR